MKAIIVDDEPMSQDTLRQLLEFCCPQVQIVGEADSAKAAFSIIQEKDPDVVFLDIEMPFGSGFDLLAKFPKIDFEVIFVTAFDQYALKAIKFCALDYLLKPINGQELMEAIKKLEQKQAVFYKKVNIKALLQNLKQPNSSSNQIALPTNDGLEFLKVSEIIRCKADGRYSNVFIKDGTKSVVCKNLKEFETLLSDHNFIRVHHSHLVNMSYVKKYSRLDGGYLTMEDGANIPVSRRKKEQFLERFH